MQLRRAAYHVLESRRNVDHFIAVAFCKADAGFSSRSGQSDAGLSVCMPARAGRPPAPPHLLIVPLCYRLALSAEIGTTFSAASGAMANHVRACSGVANSL
jgi:hypothetical protein